MLLIFHTKVSVTILARSRFYPQGVEESVLTRQENFDKHAILTRSTNILPLQNKGAIFTVFHQSSRTFQLRMSKILLGVRSTRDFAILSTHALKIPWLTSDQTEPVRIFTPQQIKKTSIKSRFIIGLNTKAVTFLS